MKNSLNLLLIILLSVVILHLGSCFDSTDVFEPEDYSFDQSSFDFLIINDSIPADSSTLMELFVELSDSEPLLFTEEIIFETQQGVFTNGRKTDTVKLETNRTATVYLLHSEPQTFVVTATVAEFSKSRKVTFVRPINGIEINANIHSSLADGTASVIITVSASGPGNLGSVSLETTLGQFNNNRNSITLTSNPGNSEVSTSLRSSSKGEATITAKANGYTDHIQIQFIEKPLDFEMTVVKDNVPADGVNQGIVHFRLLNEGIPSLPSTSVAFRTNLGTFSNGSNEISVPIGNDSIALAYLSHSRSEQAIVTASYLNKTLSVPLNFLPAYPEVINVNSDKAIATNALGQVINVDAELIRNKGNVTTGFLVYWSDSTAMGESPGIFINTTRSDNNGFAEAEYHLQDTTFIGELYLKARVETNDGIINGKTRVFFYQND